MKQTLESFIDPKNIPKKYGGELEFEFGDMPCLDPHLESVLKWEGDNTDFPHGPMYWKEKTKDGKEIEAIAVGSQNGVERNEKVGTMTKALKDDEDLKGANGNARAIKPELFRAPTAAPSDIEAPIETKAEPKEELKEKPKEDASPVVQEGELVPATRPEPVSFVTASQGIEAMSLNEKSGNLSDSTGPHATQTANLLDPSVKLAEAVETEEVLKHAEADAKHAGSNGTANGVLGTVKAGAGL
jgi:hypothetical protein